MRPLSVILMIAVLLQASSLRACVIEKVVTGSNCHGVDLPGEHPAATELTPEAPAGCPDHSDSCVCQTERHSSGDYKQVGPVFNAFPHVSSILLPTCNPISAAVPSDLAGRSISPLPVNLPLLN
jgi:hypothetical protein